MTTDDPNPKHRVVVPLDGGREIVIFLPRPLSEMSPVDLNEIVESLARIARRRGSA